MKKAWGHQNKILEKTQKQSEKLYDVIQDAAAIDQEIDYQQQQIQDIISQQTEKLTEGLEDEYDALDQLEDKSYNNNNKVPMINEIGTVKNVPAQQGKTNSDYDKMLNDLLN